MLVYPLERKNKTDKKIAKINYATILDIFGLKIKNRWSNSFLYLAKVLELWDFSKKENIIQKLLKKWVLGPTQPRKLAFNGRIAQDHI